MPRWADYSGGRPSAAALKAAGFVGVIRYIGIGGGSSLPYKRITATEYQDHVSHGLHVLLVCEGGTSDAWGGYNAGVVNAQAALNDARALGIPDSVPIFAAADAHATAAQVSAAVDYARGFRAVLGLARTGFYGFQETVSAVRNATAASLFWRCGSQPTVAEQAFTHLWQRNDGTTTVGGTVVDINEQYLPIGGATMDDGELRNRLTMIEQLCRSLMREHTNHPSGEPTLDPAWNWRGASFSPGYPSLIDGTPHTLTSFAQLADAHGFNAESHTNDLITAVGKISAGNVDVAALATALESALAPQIVSALVDQLQVNLTKKGV